MQSALTNKTIIRDFYRRAVGQGDLEFASQILADDYIQHSTALKPGKAGVLEALAYMKQLPKPASSSTPFLRLLAEGDYVVTNLSIDWGGKKKAVVDLFRFQDGQIAEHWDAVEDYPETSLNGHALMDGPMPTDDAKLTPINKQLVTRFFEDVFVERRFAALADFVAPDLIQHTPEISNGLDGLSRYLLEWERTQSARTLHRVFGDGDFVVVQSEGKVNLKQCMYYDIFRVQEQKLVEHWSVKQLIE
ncbi:nuclear transport factor 2 family protein [Spirosoma knui]